MLQKLLAFSQQSKEVNISLVTVNLQGAWLETYGDMIPAQRPNQKDVCHKTQRGQGVEGPGEADEDDFLFVGFSDTFPLSFVNGEHVNCWLGLFQICISVFYSSAPSTTKS